MQLYIDCSTRGSAIFDLHSLMSRTHGLFSDAFDESALQIAVTNATLVMGNSLCSFSLGAFFDSG